MDIKKLLFTFGAGFLVMWLLGGLWHGAIMSDFYAQHAGSGMLAEPNMMFITLGVAILAALMAYMYPLGYKGGSPVMEGLRFGIVIGLLWILPFNVVMLGIRESSVTLLAVDAAWHLVEQGIGGIVIGLVYGKPSAGEESSS